MRSGNLMIVQGGGPTAVFNCSLAEIVAEAQKQSSIGRILGSRAGIRGLLHNEVVELTHLSDAEIEQLRRTPGAALGSSRYQPSDAEMEALADAMVQFEVEYLIFLGGNGNNARSGYDQPFPRIARPRRVRGGRAEDGGQRYQAHGSVPGFRKRGTLPGDLGARAWG